MDAGATATIVAAIIAGAVALTVAFRKSALSRTRKAAIIFLLGLVSGMLTAVLAPDTRSAIVAGSIIIAAVAALFLFTGPTRPQSN